MHAIHTPILARGYVRYAVQGSRRFLIDTHVDCQVVKFQIDAAIQWPSGILSQKKSRVGWRVERCGCTHLWHGRQRLREQRIASISANASGFFPSGFM